MLRWLYRLIGGCDHSHRIRERRLLDGRENVLMLVCADCGHAVPAIKRDGETVLYAAPAFQNMRAQRAPAKVASIRRAGR